MARMRSFLTLAALLGVLAPAGCSKQVTAPETSGQDTNRVTFARAGELNSDDFVPRSNNPWFPLVPGTSYHYRSRTPDGVETQDVRVTRKTRRIMGVTTIVVEDVVRLDGEVIERTEDYFAMDEHRNVWYFGEDSRSFDPETGEESTAGSWLAGVDGAQAGILMKGDPDVGDTYHEENAPGVAEDQARVLALHARVTVRGRRFRNCLQTENFTDLEPGVREHKFYAPGVGLVLEVDLEDDTRNELVRITGRFDRDDHDR